ncbi:hypothetical protein PcaKH16_01960 [Parageobacillus caldoxylosilyticus]|nr:hypothetical protein PcaKH16_01960 [Parageobacillus caldoxylosilyticus]
MRHYRIIYGNNVSTEAEIFPWKSTCVEWAKKVPPVWIIAYSNAGGTNNVEIYINDHVSLCRQYGQFKRWGDIRN